MRSLTKSLRGREIARRIVGAAVVGIVAASLYLQRTHPTLELRDGGTAESEDRVVIVHGGLQVEGWRISARPYPCQAVRFRWQISNVGGVPLARCAPLDGVLDTAFISAPGATDVFIAHRGSPLHDDGIYASTPSPRELHNGIGFALLPGECSTCSQAIAADWRQDKDGRTDGATPLFSVPGKYFVSGAVYVDPRSRKSKVLRVPTLVLEPAGPERRALDLLDDDRLLMNALMSPVNAPHPEVAERLETFIRDFGDTSYGDYARFALARYVLGGSGERLAVRRRNIAALKDELLRARKASPAADDVRKRLVIWVRGAAKASPANSSLQPAIDDVVSAFFKSGGELRHAIDELASVACASTAELKSAIDLLEYIRMRGRSDFAYMPNVLIALKVALEWIDPGRAEPISRILRTKYADAIEVIEYFGHEIPKENWSIFRVRRCAAASQNSRRVLVTAERPPLELRLTRLSEWPHPFQAIRLRWMVTNRGSVSLGPRTWADQWHDEIRARTPGGENFGPVYRLAAPHDSVSRGGIASARAELARRESLLLRPGECCAASVTLGAQWSNNAGVVQIEKPLFPQAGAYGVVIRYPLDPATKADVEVEAMIDVREPTGAEKRACDALAADESLRNALLSPVDAPPLDVLPRLEQFLIDFAETSYGNYARFALARHHLRGCGESLRRDRLATLDFVKELSHIPLADRNADDLRRRVTQWASRRAALNDEINALIDEAVKGFMNRHPEYPFLKLASATGVTKPQREAAIELLEQVGLNESFAYMPNVLVAIKEAYAMDGPTGEWQQILRQYYPDAIEVIECLAADIPADKWSMFRVRPFESDSTKER